MAGATVRAPRFCRKPPVETRSGGDGEFVVRSGDSGPSLSLIEARTASGDRIGFTRVDTVYIGPAEPVRLVLKPPRALTVRVRDAEGRPVAGAGVSVDTFPPRVVEPGTTDAGGTARFVVPADAGVKTVSALKEGVGVDYFENYRQAPQPPYEPAPAEATLTLDGTRSVSIAVVDGAGRPVPGVDLDLSSLNKRGKILRANPLLLDVATVKTGADGVARFRWLAPTDGGNVVLHSPGHGALDYVTVRSTVPGDISDTIHVLRDGRIVGRVTNPDGSPASGVRVRAEGWGKSSPYCRRWTQTGHDGSYAIDVWADNSYLISINEADHAATPYQGIVIKEGQARDGLDFRLTEGTRLHGRLLYRHDLELERPPTVTVVLLGARLPDEFQSTPGGDTRERLAFWVRPDADGRYEVRLGRGEYEISGMVGRGPETIRVDGTGEVVRDLKGPEPALAEIEGTVIDAATGRPIAGAVVRILPSGPDSDERRPVVAGADGRFLTRRRLDEATLIATAPDGSRAAMMALKPGAKDLSVALAPAAIASGRVVDRSGRPAARASIYVRSSLAGATWTSYGPAADSSIVTLTRTDDDGRFRFDGLIPGAQSEVRALVEGPGRVEHRTVKSFTVAAPGPIDLGDLPLPAPRPAATP